MIQKINSIKKTVAKILMEEPGARDNDRLLMFKVWADQNPMIRKRNPFLHEFAKDFINGEYADPESIRRTRQKVQEQHPELRGKHYKQKKTEIESEVRKKIKTLET